MTETERKARAFDAITENGWTSAAWGDWGNKTWDIRDRIGRLLGNGKTALEAVEAAIVESRRKIDEVVALAEGRDE